MTWVYRHLNEYGEVLYIGCTSSLRSRHAIHASRSPWWAEVAHVAVEGPFDSWESYDYEAALIAHHQPPNNVEGTMRETRRGWPKVPRTEGPIPAPPSVIDRPWRAPKLPRDLAWIVSRFADVSNPVSLSQQITRAS